MSEGIWYKKVNTLAEKNQSEAADASIHLNVPQGCATFGTITSAPTTEALSGRSGI